MPSQQILTASPQQSVAASPMTYTTSCPIQSNISSTIQSTTSHPLQSASSCPNQSATSSPLESATNSPLQSATNSPLQSASAVSSQVSETKPYEYNLTTKVVRSVMDLTRAVSGGQPQTYIHLVKVSETAEFKILMNTHTFTNYIKYVNFLKK